MNTNIISRLAEPFPFEMVEAKLQVTIAEKSIGMVVFYLDSRTIQNRLDEVLGHFNWKNQYTVWHDIEGKDAKKMQKSQLCGIAIHNSERNEWVAKFDGAECSDIEPLKGGLSDSFKRAACMWGIGRYLYAMEGIWVDIEPKGNKGYQIKANQQGKLKAAYDAAVKKIFGTTTVQQQPVSSQPTSGQQPQQPAQPAAQNTSPAPQQRPPTQAPNNEQKPHGNVIPIGGYKIQDVKASGGGSQLLKLCNSEGEITSAYVKPGEMGIAVGVLLENVKITTKDGTHGKYNLVDSYDIAA